MSLNQIFKSAQTTEAAKMNISDLPAAQRARIEREVADAYRASDRMAGKAHATQDSIIKSTVRVYSDLHTLGYAGLHVSNLKPVHLAALLGMWRNGLNAADGTVLRKPVARSTAGNMWSVLRGWCALLGKNGMAAEFQLVWPDDQPREKKVRPPRDEDAAYTRRSLIHTVSDQTYRALIAGWKDVPSWQMIYWVVRACRVFKIDVNDALRMEPFIGSQRMPGNLIIKGWKGADAAVLGIDTEEKRALVHDLIDFTHRMRITKLCWDKSDCQSIEVASRRVTNAVRYQVGKIVGASDTHTGGDE